MPQPNDRATEFTPLLVALLSVIAGLFGASSSCEAQTKRDPSRRMTTNSRLTLGTQPLRSASVRAGDFDSDGDLDLVVANGRHWPQQNFLYFNQNSARFNVARRLGEDLETSYACEPGDLDGDGDLDLVIGNDHAPTRVWLGDGTGHFAKHAILGDPTSLRGVTLADVNGDDFLDVILICRGRPNQVHLNDGRASFQTQISFGGERESTLGVAVADLNEDGWPDLILANRDQQPNAILFGIDGQRFSEPKRFGDQTQSSRAVVTADFNADGKADWAVGNLGDSNRVYLGDGKGGTIGEVPFGLPDGMTYGLAVADMNGDEMLDLVTCNVRQKGVVAINQNAAESFDMLAYGSDETSSYGLCVGDFDSDGDPDIAVANSDDVNRIYLNHSSARFVQ
ncbi:MAG: VCBS repeat-containing protein [Planctomycetota bacterium]